MKYKIGDIVKYDSDSSILPDTNYNTLFIVTETTPYILDSSLIVYTLRTINGIRNFIIEPYFHIFLFKDKECVQKQRELKLKRILNGKYKS